MDWPLLAQLRDHRHQHLGRFFCEIMSILDIIIEPVGSSKPKFSSNLDLSAFKKSQGQGVALTCPAQGSPSPGFRYF